MQVKAGSRAQWCKHKRERELREQSHRGPGIEGYFNHARKDMNEFESLLANLEEEVYEKGSMR